MVKPIARGRSALPTFVLPVALLQLQRTLYRRGGELAARMPHVARHNVVSGRRKLSGKNHHI